MKQIGPSGAERCAMSSGVGLAHWLFHARGRQRALAFAGLVRAIGGVVVGVAADGLEEADRLLLPHLVLLCALEMEPILQLHGFPLLHVGAEEREQPHVGLERVEERGVGRDDARAGGDAVASKPAPKQQLGKHEEGHAELARDGAQAKDHN
eukprot:4373122-Pleurochrysis_carterae.AAC.1